MAQTNPPRTANRPNQAAPTASPIEPRSRPAAHRISATIGAMIAVCTSAEIALRETTVGSQFEYHPAGLQGLYQKAERQKKHLRFDTPGIAVTMNL